MRRNTEQLNYNIYIHRIYIWVHWVEFNKVRFFICVKKNKKTKKRLNSSLTTFQGGFVPNSEGQSHPRLSHQISELWWVRWVCFMSDCGITWNQLNWMNKQYLSLSFIYAFVFLHLFCTFWKLESVMNTLCRLHWLDERPLSRVRWSRATFLQCEAVPL